MDVSKIMLVHFEEGLKDLHTKKGELLKRGVGPKIMSWPLCFSSVHQDRKHF